MTRGRSRLCAMAAAALLFVAGRRGVGQTGPPQAGRPRTARPSGAPKRAPAPSPATPADTSSSETATAAADTGDTPANGVAPGTKVKTKTYTFGAMDVEGKLKTPQLLYFLNRVKLELDMSAPDQRSFMKELAQSADDKSL